MDEILTIKEYQKRVDEWIKKYGVRYFDEKTNTILLMEEVGEFARWMARQYGEQSLKNQSTDVMKEISDEIGDILFVLTCLVNQMGMDLEDIIKKNFLKKTDRDHERHLKNPKLKGEQD